LGVAIYSGRKRDIFCATGINDDHPTSENGKLALLTSGRPAFREHAKRAEGSGTTPASHVQKVLRTERKNSNITKLQKDHAAQRGRDASGQRRA